MATRSAGLAAAALLVGLASACGSSSSSSSSSGGVSAGGGNGIGQCSSSTATPTAAPASAVPTPADSATVQGAVTVAEAFLKTLNASQQKKVVFSYADLDAKRCSWSNFPDGIFQGRQGARLGDLTAAQKAAALKAVASVLSASGYTQVEQEMLADQQLKGDSVGNASFGQDDYHLALYGTPSTTTPWTLQYGGHHLVVHVSVGGGALSVSPHFTGVQPVSFSVDGTSYQPLRQDTQDMFGIFGAMSATEKSQARLAGSFDDLVMGPGNDTGYPKQTGLPYGSLTAAEQALVKKAIADYVGDAADTLAQPLLDLYYSQLDQTTVGWANSTSTNAEGSYLRIDGPRLWIEWFNTKNPGQSGYHVHSVYRDKELDYGTGAG